MANQVQVRKPSLAHRLASRLNRFLIRRCNRWSLSRFPPFQPPHEYLMRYWESEQREYTAWIHEQERPLTVDQWSEQREWALEKQAVPRPCINIVTPVYNTDPEQLAECLYSVQTQSYPYWVLWLVDDASTSEDTLRVLEEWCARDARVFCIRNKKNCGISVSTNRAIDHSHGDFIGFLDHDDVLSADALYRVAKAIAKQPDTDFIYSDRDMLSLQGRRFMHLMKPNWSPETLLSGNYLFHFCVYRRSMLKRLGKVRPNFDGSQDYDLALRASEKARSIIHIPRVLYHWRQHEGSVSLVHDCKDYAYQAGMKALREALQRRGLKGDVSEIETLWRGNYRVMLARPEAQRIAHIALNETGNGVEIIKRHAEKSDADYFVVTGPGVQPPNQETLGELCSWLTIPGVGISTGKLIDNKGLIWHAGMVMRPDGKPLSVYQGYDESEAGYMATTSIVHNVSVPHPCLFAVHRELLTDLDADQSGLDGGFAILDMALKANEAGWRVLYTPFAELRIDTEDEVELWNERQQKIFSEHWQGWLSAGDPFYHPALTLTLNDMGLKSSAEYQSWNDINPRTPTI